VRLTFSSDAVVVVAGMPGAGKTTLIRRAVDPAVARVVDTDDRPRRAPAPVLYAVHYARVLAAILGRRPAVIHSRGTHAGLRRTIAPLAALRGRPAHLILLDAERAEAEAGQRARGRTIAPAKMDRQATRWRRLVAAVPRREGWASIVVLDREQAARTCAIEFTAAAELRAAAANM
jgi:GTPase SAR1 family protein